MLVAHRAPGRALRTASQRRAGGHGQAQGGQGPAGNKAAPAEGGAGAGATSGVGAAGKQRWRRDLERAVLSEAVGSRQEGAGKEQLRGGERA